MNSSKVLRVTATELYNPVVNAHCFLGHKGYWCIVLYRITANLDSNCTCLFSVYLSTLTHCYIQEHKLNEELLPLHYSKYILFTRWDYNVWDWKKHSMFILY